MVSATLRLGPHQRVSILSSPPFPLPPPPPLGRSLSLLLQKGCLHDEKFWFHQTSQFSLYVSPACKLGSARAATLPHPRLRASFSPCSIRLHRIEFEPRLVRAAASVPSGSLTARAGRRGGSMGALRSGWERMRVLLPWMSDFERLPFSFLAPVRVLVLTRCFSSLSLLLKALFPCYDIMLCTSGFLSPVHANLSLCTLVPTANLQWRRRNPSLWLLQTPPCPRHVAREGTSCLHLSPSRHHPPSHLQSPLTPTIMSSIVDAVKDTISSATESTQVRPLSSSRACTRR